MKKLAAGNLHSVAIQSDGTLWSWGQNYSGQLGNSTLYYGTARPTQVGSDHDWAAVAAGSYHNVALKTDGTLWAWGFNDDGELGDGTLINKRTPVRVGAASDWAAVAAGSYHSVALKTDGTLWAWGFNDVGELGDGTLINKTTPVRVGAASDWAAVAAGSYHNVALKTDGTLWAWGYNGDGQLGDGTGVDRTAPVRVGIASGWAAMAAGARHTVAVKADGTLWAWGWNYGGQLGDGTGISKATPARVGTASDWATVAAGAFHTVALKANGTLWAWGLNNYGQVGIATLENNKYTPCQVGSSFAAAAAGIYHTVAFKADGTLWAWGWNQYGQLGVGYFDYAVPYQTRVLLPEAPIMVAISAIASPVAVAQAVNRRGEIVGDYYPAANLPRPYVWTTTAGLSDLGTLGGDFTQAYDINDQGVIVGEATDSSGALVGFRLRPLDQDGNGVPDLWYKDVDGDGDDVNDLMEPLEYGQGQYRIEIAGINNAGVIAGDYFASDAPRYRRGVLWLPDKAPVDLGGPAGFNTEVSDLNDSGVVVGSTGPFPSLHPFAIFPQDRDGRRVWYEDNDGNGLNDLFIELPEFDGYMAKAINNAGTICLRSSMAPNTLNSRLWRNGEGVVAVLNPGGDVYSRANGLNDHEQVVGRIETGDGKHAEAFFWTAKGGFIKLPGLGGTITSAYAIDPNGTTVVGVGTDASGVSHAVRWSIPVNTPQGNGVRVLVESSGTGAGPVGVTLQNVTSPGATVVSASTTGPELPSGFMLGNPPVFYELSTTATFDGYALVSFTWLEDAFLNEYALRLFHYEGGAWKDVTTVLDTGNNIIYGRVTSFSPFVLLENALVVKIDGPAPGFLASVNSPVTFAGSFTDSQGSGPYTAQWTFSRGTVPEYSVSGTFSSTGAVQDQISLAAAGVYSVKLTVAGSGQPAEATTVGNDLPAYVVIYDPTGGFVTGGGFINSPPGAYVADPMLVGKGSFGFVSKYQKGANVPTGNTEFQFKAGDLNFKSTSYEWLVVAGARAQFKGVGTINGGGNYGFMLTAVDGQVNGGGGADRFRIKIWDEGSGVMIYDNQNGTADTAGLVSDGTLLQGGSILIHRP